MILVVTSRIIISKLVRRFARTTHRIEHRTNLVIKYMHLLTTILAIIIALIIIWGVQTKDIIIIFHHNGCGGSHVCTMVYFK
jgi:hypothetical protein